MMAMTMSSTKLLPRIFSASSFFLRPIMMLALGAEPMLTSAAKALTAMMIGMVTPTPVKATSPIPSI